MATAADKASRDPAFMLLAGRPSLDLVATLGRRHATPVERVPDAAALARWFLAAGLFTTAPPVSEARTWCRPANCAKRSTPSPAR